MADPFVAEIRVFPFNFAPKGWAQCDGQLIAISQNTALFSLLGTTYGGNGKSNFALPNLQGAVPMHPGQGPGLSLHDLGESAGTDTVTLLQTEIPVHTHQAMANAGGQVSSNAVNTAWGSGGFGSLAMYATPPAGSLVNMSPQALAMAGNDQPHNNLQPYLVLNFCIALQGIFPPRG